MGQSVILRLGTGSAQLVPSAILDGFDLAGCTVIGVADDFSWSGKCVDWTALAIVDDIAGLRAAKWAAVKAIRDALIAGGCDTPKGRVDTTIESQIKITGAAQVALLAQTAGDTEWAIGWTMSDNTTLAHNAAEMIALGRAVATHITAAHAAAVALRTAIEAAGTAEDIAAIDIEAGWPA